MQLHDDHEFQNVVADVVASRYIPHLFVGAKFNFKKEFDSHELLELPVLRAVAKAKADRDHLLIRVDATRFDLISVPNGTEKYKGAFAHAHR
jgi:hypothetical protein